MTSLCKKEDKSQGDERSQQNRERSNFAREAESENVMLPRYHTEIGAVRRRRRLFQGHAFSSEDYHEVRNWTGNIHTVVRFILLLKNSKDRAFLNQVS